MKIIYKNSKCVLLNSDVLEGLKTIPSNSIDCIYTSPPYWKLRDYGYIEQIGLEKTPEEYIGKLKTIFTEIYRIIKETGTLFINIGDTYENKHLCMIPSRLVLALIDSGWILRNEIVIAKRNGICESVKDRFTRMHEMLYFFTKKPKYYFDLDSIRDPYLDNPLRKCGKKADRKSKRHIKPMNLSKWESSYEAVKASIDRGKNPGNISSFWPVVSKPKKTNHFATSNENTIEKPIFAGCPVNGIVLDPFAGICTVGRVALQYNRKFIGIDAKEEFLSEGKESLEILCQKVSLFEKRENQKSTFLGFFSC